MKDRWAKVVVAVVTVLLLSGCALSLSEIRAKEPSYTITSTKTPQELSKCIEFKMREEEVGFGGVHTVVREEYENNTYRVIATWSGRTPIADILVKPKDNGSVVEFRSEDYWLIAPVRLEIIERCAQ